MNKLKGVITTVIAVCGICLIIGCQEQPRLFWYKPDTSATFCSADWAENCHCSKDCMFKKGYSLFKREELPPGMEIMDVDGHHIKEYGVAGEDSATAMRREKEYVLNVRKRWLESHSDVSDNVKQAILGGYLTKGMSYEEAQLAWDSLGNTNWTRVSSDSEGYVIMRFGYNRLTFLNGLLVHWIEVSR